ncbi:hypothetical protein CPB86DRAFT_784022, partial [Serendipita vermifera]
MNIGTTGAIVVLLIAGSQLLLAMVTPALLNNLPHQPSTKFDYPKYCHSTQDWITSTIKPIN